MKKLIQSVALLLCVLAAPLFAQQPAVEEPRVRFSVVDLYVTTTNAPLAAYQLEFAVTNGEARIVGIEGGDAAAFRQPPFYDPLAIQRERVLLAAFSLEPNEALPAGRVRVARIHLQTTGTPQYALRLQTVAGSDGVRLEAGINLEERRSTR